MNFMTKLWKVRIMTNNKRGEISPLFLLKKVDRELKVCYNIINLKRGAYQDD